MDVKYNIVVAKSGTGEAEAVSDFNAVKQAAATTTTAFAQTETSTKNLTNGFKAFHGVLTVAGLQTFPQLTAGVMVTKQALDGLRASNVQLQAGIGLTAASIAGLTAIVITGAQAWITYKANQQEALSTANLEAQTQEFAARLKDELTAAANRGEITNEMFTRLSRTLGTLAGNQQVRDFFHDLRTPDAQSQIADLNRDQAFGAASRRMFPTHGLSQEQQRGSDMARVQMDYNQQAELFNSLREKGLITERELDAFTTEADTRRMNSLANLRDQMTDVQKLGQQAKELFASGLATAIVNAFKGGEDALKNFASTFAAQIAQMILQMEILKALSWLGLSEGGVMFAARGGMFPQFAASGLAGVQSVSSATYFPKFNVVAGEAGREMLTVLSRPRMMEIGGIQAAVGNAGPNRLAITNANDLENGAGGKIVIQVQGTPDFEARVIHNSVNNAVVRVTNDMRADTHISRGIRRLAT